MADNFQALVQAILDGKSLTTLENQIKGLGDTEIRLRNVTVNTAEVVRSIQNALNGASFSIRVNGLQNGGGGSGGNPIHNEVQSIVNDIDLVNGGLSHMRDMLQGAGFNKSSIQSLTDEMDRMSITATRLRTTMLEDGSIRMTITGVDELGRAVNLVREYDKETGRIIYTTKTFTQELATSQSVIRSMGKINFGIETGDFQSKINGITDSVGRLNTTTPVLDNNVQQLRAAFDALRNTQSSDQERIAAWERFNALLPIINGQIRNIEQAERASTRAANERNQADRQANEVLSRSATLSNNIQSWMNKNTEAAKRFGNQLRDMQTRLNNNQDPATLRQIQLAFGRIKSEANAAGLVTSEFGKQLKSALLTSAGLGSTVMIVQRLVRVFREAVKAVTELSDAMVQFRIVTNGSEESYNRFYKATVENAKEIGGSINDLIAASTTYARLGYSMEDSQVFAKYTEMLKNIGDIDTQSAQNAMTALTKAFGVNVNNIETVMDKLVTVGRNSCPAA